MSAVLPHDYVVEIALPDEAANLRVACGGGCGWTGTADKLAEIEGCALTPGDPSPAGRCPECGSLAYIAKPETMAERWVRYYREWDSADYDGTNATLHAHIERRSEQERAECHYTQHWDCRAIGDNNQPVKGANCSYAVIEFIDGSFAMRANHRGGNHCHAAFYAFGGPDA